jgi:lysine 6-dehydrogenase
VINGLPYDVAIPVVKKIVESGTLAVDLCTGRDAVPFHEVAVAKGVVYVNGIGATPGITNMMAKHLTEVAAADTGEARGYQVMDVSFAAFRAAGLSRSLADILLWEFDRDNDELKYWKDGVFTRVPPLDDPREIDFSAPIGRQTVYHVPHEETQFLPKSLPSLNEVHVRGCFPKETMDFVKSCAALGMLSSAEKTTFRGEEISKIDLMAETLCAYDTCRETKTFAYGLNTSLTETSGDQTRTYSCRIEFDQESGAWSDYSDSFTYRSAIGLPLIVAAEMLIAGQFDGFGVVGPESVFACDAFFKKLQQDHGMMLKDM